MWWFNDAGPVGVTGLILRPLVPLQVMTCLTTYCPENNLDVLTSWRHRCDPPDLFFRCSVVVLIIILCGVHFTTGT